MRPSPSSQFRVRLGKFTVSAPANPLGAVVILVVVLAVVAALVVLSLSASSAASHLLQLVTHTAIFAGHTGVNAF
jgi:hypothetical protein